MGLVISSDCSKKEREALMNEKSMKKATERIKKGLCPKCGKGKPSGNNVCCDTCIRQWGK
jgi:hypothetical protein